MSLINKLHELITPHILAAIKNQEGESANKTNLLDAFYAIFAARLSDDAVYQRANALPNNELEHGHHLLNVIFSDASTGQDQIATLSGQLADEYGVPEITARTAIAAAAPLVLARIQDLAGTTPVPAFLRNELGKEANRLPSWAYVLLPAGLFASAAAASTATTAAKPAAHVNTASVDQHYEKQEKSSFLKTILPIVGLIIFAGLAWMLLRGCQHNPAPMAAPTAAEQVAQATEIAQAPATLSLALDEAGQAIYSHRAQVGDTTLADKVRSAVTQVFGAGDYNIETTTAHATTMPAAEYLPAILELMKGVPNASVVISDHVVRFNATTAEDVAKLVEGAKSILPEGFTIEAEPMLDVNTAVASSIESARDAIVGLGDTVEADEVDALIYALNLQIINFETDSDVIPAQNQEILDLAATKLIALPEATLRIIGHTDNQGSHEYNQELSESRAESVRDYLVSKGVPAERLDVAGASFDKPIASNATEQGRFQNRRIEFALRQEGETLTKVGNAPAQTSEQQVSSDAANTTPADKK